MTRDSAYKELRPNLAIAHTFKEHMSEFGRPFLGESETAGGASTDMGNLLFNSRSTRLTVLLGNVSYEVPGFHCGFSIDTGDPRVGPHSPKFAVAAGTRDALVSALECGKGMAATGYDLLADDGLASTVRKEFEKWVSRHSTRAE